MDTLVSPREAARTRPAQPTRGSAARLPQPRGRFAPPERRAESFYRRSAGLAALVSGVLAFAGVVMSPVDGVGIEGYLRSSTGTDDAWAVVLRYGFLLLVPAAFGLAHLARRRARRLSNWGLALVVLSGLSGLAAVDFAVVGTAVGTVLLTLAFVRAGFTRWPVPVVVAAGWIVLAAADLVVGAAIGTALIAVATSVVGVRVLYASDDEWDSGIPD